MIAQHLKQAPIDRFVDTLLYARDAGDDPGRIFILGSGGSAANASHAVNDLRKLCGFEAYCPTDNVAELTARANDDGWPSVFVGWLTNNHLGFFDVLLVLSVGGGSPSVSENIIHAIDYAKTQGTRVLAIVGRSHGYAAQHADVAICVPCLDNARLTPHTEAFQSVLLHLLVSHPLLQKNQTTW